MTHTKILLMSFILTLLLTPAAIIFSRRNNILSYPTENSIHTAPMPFIGGVVLFTVFFILSWIFKSSDTLLPFFLGSAAILLIGLYDDFRGLNAKIKIALQLLAVLVLILSGVFITSLRTPFAGFRDLGLWSLPITIVWFMFMINLVNIIDGLDGLAAGLSGITFLVMLNYLHSGSMNIQLLIMIGSIMGFLIFNFYPAKIFLGNSGSSFLGFSIAYFSLIGYQKGNALIILMGPLAVLSVHVFDAAYAVYRRLRSGSYVLKGDKRHLHHLLLKRMNGHRKTVLIFYLASSILAFLLTRLY